MKAEEFAKALRHIAKCGYPVGVYIRHARYKAKTGVTADEFVRRIRRALRKDERSL